MLINKLVGVLPSLAPLTLTLTGPEKEYAPTLS